MQRRLLSCRATLIQIDLISDSIVGTINQQHAELQQLKKGFRETLQMELLVCLHPDEIRALLVASSLYDVKAAFFHDHFVVSILNKVRMDKQQKKQPC